MANARRRRAPAATEDADDARDAELRHLAGLSLWQELRETKGALIVALLVAALAALAALRGSEGPRPPPVLVHAPRRPAPAAAHFVERPGADELLAIGAERAGTVVEFALEDGTPLRVRKQHLPNHDVIQDPPRLPEAMFATTRFVLTAADPYGSSGGPLTVEEERAANEALRRELLALDTVVSAVAPARLYNPDTGWAADGWVATAFPPMVAERDHVHYHNDLDFEMALSGARFGQPAVWKWYPKQWGQAAEHATVVQKVLPTRTGMKALVSEGALAVYPASGD